MSIEPITSIPIAEAKARLDELVEQLGPGQSIIIVRDEIPVAQITALPDTPSSLPRPLGFLQGVLTIVADDDSHLDGFQDYM
jgi:antitoxin (DNA-binding transcriptional repressor) of toxin-antitoxin stability system